MHHVWSQPLYGSSATALVLESALGTASQDMDMTLPIEEAQQTSSQSWAEIKAQDEEREHWSMTDQATGVRTEDQEHGQES